jgi:hypothetical protein
MGVLALLHVDVQDVSGEPDGAFELAQVLARDQADIEVQEARLAAQHPQIDVEMREVGQGRLLLLDQALLVVETAQVFLVAGGLVPDRAQPRVQGLQLGEIDDADLLDLGGLRHRDQLGDLLQTPAGLGEDLAILAPRQAVETASVGGRVSG